MDQVTFEDAGLKRMGAFLQALKSQKIQVGYQSPEGRIKYDSGISVAKLAAVHEFGGDELEARPFIRPVLVTQRDAITALAKSSIESHLRLVVAGADPESEAAAVGKDVGEFVVSKIRDRLKSAQSWAAKLDVETVERKGSSTPLEETGLLIDSLSWRVSAGSKTLARGKA